MPLRGSLVWLMYDAEPMTPPTIFWPRGCGERTGGRAGNWLEWRSSIEEELLLLGRRRHWGREPGTEAGAARKSRRGLALARTQHDLAERLLPRKQAPQFASPSA